MTDQTYDERIPDDEDDDAPRRTAWELPETVAVAVLLAFLLFVVGDLVAALVASTSTMPFGQPGDQTQLIGASIEDGAAWAYPLVAIALLAVIGLVWWQLEARAGPTGATDDEQMVEAFDHVRRANQIMLWTRVALVVTALGSLAQIAGFLLNITGQGIVPPATSSHTIALVGNALAVMVLAGAGLHIANRTGLEWVPDEPSHGSAPEPGEDGK